jgi:hypothetical protein
MYYDDKPKLRPELVDKHLANAVAYFSYPNHKTTDGFYYHTEERCFPFGMLYVQITVSGLNVAGIFEVAKIPTEQWQSMLIAGGRNT